MLAGLADRLPSPQLFRFSDTCIITTLAPRCATIAFNASGGVTYYFPFEDGKKGLIARISDNRSLYAAVTDVIAEEKRRLLGL